jgi:hypothetical protein
MLETFAYDLQNRTELFHMAAAAVVTIIGFATGLFLRRHAQWTLTRAPHIALWALLFAAGTGLGFGALLIDAAMEHDMLWVIYAVFYGVVLILGILYAVISRARAIDAYGNSKKAWFGIIPLIWFDLALRQSQHPVPASSGRKVFNALIVVAALGIFVGAKVAGKMLETMIQDHARSAVYSPKVLARATAGHIRSAGLATALGTMQSSISPQVVDEVTSIVAASVTEDTLTIYYLVDPSVTFITDHVRQNLVKNHCDDPAMRAYLEAGATMAFLYTHQAGDQVAHFSIVARDCTI